jgi:hypothetical protein
VVAPLDPIEQWTKVDFGGPVAHKDILISNYGRIQRVKHSTGNQAFMKGSIDNRGRKIINVLLENGKYATRYVHHVVAEKFVKQPSVEHSRIIHLDHDLLNNHHTNLRWVTTSEWRQHLRRRTEALKE